MRAFISVLIMHTVPIKINTQNNKNRRFIAIVLPRFRIIKEGIIQKGRLEWKKEYSKQDWQYYWKK